MRDEPRRRVRIPIAAIMVLIAMIAVEMGALRVASPDSVSMTRYLTIGTLAVATWLARSRRVGRGAGWFGFALAGWAYFAIALDAEARHAVASGVRPAIAVLPPVTLLGLFFDVAKAGTSPLLIELLWHRYEILQSILTLVVASIGGMIFWLIAPRRGAPFREEEPHAGRLEFDDIL